MFTREPYPRLEEFAITCTKRLLQQNLPTADSCTAANEATDLYLLDHLVGGSEERRRHSEAEHEGYLRVDDQLELARLYNGQICRLRALEDAPGIDAGLSIGIRDVGTIAHQSTSFDRVAIRKRRGNCMACRHSGKLYTPDDV